MKNKWLVIFLTLTVCLYSAMIPGIFATAEPHTKVVVGGLYRFDADKGYDYTAAEKHEETVAGDNTYGSLALSGSIVTEGVKDGIPSYGVDGGTVDIVYSYNDSLLNADVEKWHLVDDGGNKVAGIALGSSIKKGALVVQTSRDGSIWYSNAKQTNQFASVPTNEAGIYTVNSVQLAGGVYCRVFVAYRLGKKIGEHKVALVVNQEDYEYQRIAEVYDFFLYDVNNKGLEEGTPTKRLGSLTKTGNNGYTGSYEIGINDPHYNWNMGHFFVSGYTREEKDDTGKPVFLKNVGDKITLWFNLEQDIKKLHGNNNLSVTEDIDGYDQNFSTEPTNLGHGALIIQYTDEKGENHEPEIYTNYLEANAATSADTIVRLFEEGDYDVALDYEIKNTPRKIVGLEVAPEYHHYRVSFSFSVRNGNCMVFPYDILTESELSDEAITPNGFRLDMAKSRYLTIDVQMSVVTEGARGYTEDVRFNRPAKDNDVFKEPGIYTFSVGNRYTGETTTKRIYVGTDSYLRALSVNKISVSELNAQINKGATISTNGTISQPKETAPIVTASPMPQQTVDNSETESKEVENTETAATNEKDQAATPTQADTEQRGGSNNMALPVVCCAAVIAGIIWIVIRKKRK